MEAPGLGALQDCVSRLLADGADDADAYFEDSVSTTLGRQGGRLERVGGGQDAGLGLRRVVGDRTSYGFTNDLRPESLEGLARGLGGLAPGSTLDAQRAPARHAVSCQRPAHEVPLEEKAALLDRIERWARAVDPRLSEVQVGYSDLRKRVNIVQADGSSLEDERVQIALNLRCVASDGGTLQTAYNVLGGSTGFELVSDEDEIRNWTIRTAEQAIRMLSAVPAPSGSQTVVLASSAGGTMVHEAIGHGLEADLVQKQLSVYHGRVGQPVAAPAITILDDATLAGRRGFLNVDDEGSPGQRTVLVDAGILRGFMYDRLTARRDGVQSTGNGRRESYRHRPIVRMTNTLIASGEEEPQAIIEATGRGLLVTRMGGGQVDTTTGNFVFKVNEAFLLDRGRVGSPVRGATLIGNGPKVLEQIDRVGSDLGFDLGTCGKDGQGVPVADAQPTLRIPSITVGGEQA